MTATLSILVGAVAAGLLRELLWWLDHRRRRRGELRTRRDDVEHSDP